MAGTTDTPGRGKPRLEVRIILAVAVFAAIGFFLWLFVRPGNGHDSDHFTGYVVSDDIYMSSPVAGTLTSLAVKRGDRVEAGAPLFSIDPTVRGAQAEQARALVAASQAQVQQQQAGLARAQADVAAAQAEADRYEVQLRRLTAAQNEKAGSVAQLDIDQARASHEGALRKRDAARAQLGSVSAAIAAARAQVRQAEAGLASAQRELADLSPAAPGAGRIEDVMFKPGESVAPNVPVVSIVPDGQVKVRFYVPQARVNSCQPGRTVAIACDGCASGMTAVIEFVATEPEYTPPVIYSLDARQKLVFMVEALPADPRALRPGQPVDVALAAGVLTGR